ncbi:MAG: hypothetical protein IT233_08925 [Bacteroidia bacterium]|nr:hypothetical protein [Bacteroidia bacterium]
MKRKVKLDRPEISSEEIRKGRDFKSVLNKVKAAPAAKPFYKTWGFLAGTAALVTTAAIWLMINYFSSVEHTRGEITVVAGAGLQETTKDISLHRRPGSPFIAPPFDGLDMPFEKFKLSAEKGGRIRTSKGSFLTFPESSLQNDEGKQVKGDVEVKVREFHDPVDFFLSGIPMTYDSSGVHYDFESAGMIEVYAFQGGKVLKIDPEKPVKVEMVSNDPDGSYNVYSLDTAIKNWIYRGRDELQKFPDQKSPVAVSDTADRLPVLTRADNLSREITEVRKDINQMENTKPMQPKQHTKGRYTFNIDVDKKEFPELTIYKDVLWEVDPSNTDFTDDMYKITWEDAVIKEGEVRGTYQIILKSRTLKKVFSVSPVFEGVDFEKAKKLFDDRFSQFQQQLNLKKETEKKLQSEYNEVLSQIKKNNSLNGQVQTEMKKRQAESDLQTQLFGLNANVLRTFSIAGFGIWNCDNPHLHYANPFSAVTYLKNGQPLDAVDICLVNLKLNGMVTTWVPRQSVFTTRLASGKNMAWTISQDMKLLVCMEKEFTYAQSHPGAEGLVSLVFTEAPVDVGSPDAIKKYLFGTLSLE